MRFLADESCDYTMVRALRNAGRDVAAVAESNAQASDSEAVELAVSDARVLLTEDKDFGQLVLAHGEPSLGVVLLRYRRGLMARSARMSLKLVANHERRLVGCFVVVAPAEVRFRRTPE